VTDKIKVYLKKNDTLEGGKGNVDYIKSENNRRIGFCR
jgi:hypothetical protein